jgi:hypothetical protein
MKHDLNYIAALEKAMREQYGEISIQNPKANWDTEKEKIYLEESKKLLKKEYSAEVKEEKLDLGGILIAKKLINKNIDRQCIVCEKYSFNRDDDLYLNKYKVCNFCFIDKVEGREDKWQKGLK